MKHDLSLWNGDFFHVTERSTFEALEMIVEVLPQYPGAKALVLFSDGNWPPPSGNAAGFAAKLQIALPKIPRETPFLVGPFLGRRAGPDVVVQGGVKRTGKKSAVDDPSEDRIGSATSFAPVLASG